MMHLGVSDLRTCYFKCVRNSKAFLSHGPPRIFDEQHILLNTVQGRHVKSIFDEQQILNKLRNAYDRGLLFAPNNITFYDKRNGVLRARKTIQHNIHVLHILIFSSISALLFSCIMTVDRLRHARTTYLVSNASHSSVTAWNRYLLIEQRCVWKLCQQNPTSVSNNTFCIQHSYMT